MLERFLQTYQHVYSYFMLRDKGMVLILHIFIFFAVISGDIFCSQERTQIIFDRPIWPIAWTLTSTIISSLSGPGSNENRIVLKSPSDVFCCHNCCGLQIRPVEEQLKQRVICERYCISRKGKSYKGSTSRSQLAVSQSNVS